MTTQPQTQPQPGQVLPLPAASVTGRTLTVIGELIEEMRPGEWEYRIIDTDNHFVDGLLGLAYYVDGEWRV